MAVHQKMEEAGWFYHAPAKRQVVCAQDIPPFSQIPGLNDVEDFEPEPVSNKKWIRETDSKYVKMAKKGGRPDLLRFKEYTPKSKDPVGYPRNDWYYQEDNEPIEPTNQGKHFTLPDYMVHEAYKPNGDQHDYEAGRPKRLPYAYDRLSIYERDGGHKVTDKTVKLPENKPNRVRFQQKHKQKNVLVKLEKPTIQKNQITSSHPHYKTMPELYKESQRPLMGKIIGNNYSSEWHNELQKWHSQQDRKDANQNKGKMMTEYQDTTQQVFLAKQAAKKPNKKMSPRTEKKSQDDVSKPLFKLSRFTKVPAKTDSHRYIPEKHRSQPILPEVSV